MKIQIILPLLAGATMLLSTNANAQSTIGSNTLSGTAPNPTQYLGSYNAYNVIFKAGNKEAMRIINNTGNTGMPNGNINIGPLINGFSNIAKVTINAAGTINNTPDNLVGLSVAKQTTTSGSRAVFIVPHVGQSGYNWLTQAGDAGIYWTDVGGGWNNSAGLVIAPQHGSRKGIRITKDGNVGIGTELTNNPNNYMLAVNGTIGAKAVKVEVSSATWPDYVFHKDYKLKTISELESFVTTHKHLPNIPSAAEMEKEGLDMATMDAILLEKIEELSLYIIEQNKRIELLEKKIHKK